jgi:hypothetical protein
VHSAEEAKPAAEVESDANLRVLKLEAGFGPDEPIVRNDPDVVEYYKLVDQHANAGLFREKEMDVNAEFAAKEREEIEADRAEDAYYATLAFNRRVGEAATLLAATNPERPGAAAKILADLESRDAKAAAALTDLVARVGESARAGGGGKETVLRTLADVSPTAFSSAAEKATAIAGVYDALAKHSKARSLESKRMA